MRCQVRAQILCATQTCIGIRRGKVSPNTCAIDPLPPKGVVRKLVYLVPRNLLGQKIVYVALRKYLRRCCGVSEYVRQPHIFCCNTELLLEIALAIQELPHERFATGKVR